MALMLLICVLLICLYSQKCPVLSSLINCQLIRAPSNVPHNFLHSCLATMPPFTSTDHYVLMGILKGIKSTMPYISKQERFNVFTHCIQESARAAYQSESEVRNQQRRLVTYDL